MQGYVKPFNFAVIAAIFLAISLGQALEPCQVVAAPPKVLGVDEFMKNGNRYQGTVSLEGVVSAVAPEQQAISLIDSREFQDCGVTTCAQLTLPVHWCGSQPAVRDLVRLEGQVQEVKGKLMFVADKLEKVVRP